MRLILSLLLILSAQSFLSVGAEAQTQTQACLSITVRDEDSYEVDRFVCYGRITFTANVTGLSPTDKPGFSWTASGGQIVGGQGTSTITVLPDEGLGREVTATVDVSGVASLTTSCNTRVAEAIRISECLCPDVSISCPVDRNPGEPVTISVSISGGKPQLNPKYTWTVSAGKITNGQGTPTITVDTSSLAGQNLTATVEVDGLPLECDRTRSCSFSTTVCPAPSARKFDDYREVSWINEEVRLHNYAFNVKQLPGTVGYVIIYGPRRVDQHIMRVRKFLVEKRQLDVGRLVLINGGYNKKTKVELWIAPTGSTAPKPDPDFED